VAKILYVDDDPDILAVIARILEHGGFQVVAVNDEREAIKRTVADQPDLIMLDIMMPYMDGYQVCKLLKSIEALRHIPVVFLTQKDDEASVHAGLAVGAAEYLTKPSDLYELCNALNRVLRLNDLGVYRED